MYNVVLVSSFMPDVGCQYLCDCTHPASSPELAQAQAALSSSDPCVPRLLASLWQECWRVCTPQEVGGSSVHEAHCGFSATEAKLAGLHGNLSVHLPVLQTHL